ncbi:AAC(3) family N-acetyltransferase [Streptomyces sp. NPDC046862]|uniref:AAC(3) family N-acetyltransferase n=1 Tax=Streptomyces sp. NPDC046862 TaxID=3154603 RepID=UPI0034554578
MNSCPTVRAWSPSARLVALGPEAARIVSGHALNCLLGERSPLGRLYGEGAYVLLLGAGFDDSHFGEPGRWPESSAPGGRGPIVRGRIGAADSPFFPLRRAVDTAADRVAARRHVSRDLSTEADRA